jgi:hypothetical protein
MDKDFELNIPIAQHTSNSQTQIFYSKIFDEFVTVENTMRLNIWSLEEPCITKTVRLFQPATIDPDFRLIDFVELTTLKLFLITSNRNELVIYDTRREFVVLQKALKVNKINSVIYSSRSHAIVLVTHDNNVPIFKLENKFNTYEINFVGWLIGHLNFVHSGCLIESLDCLITIDEGSIVKFWNLQLMQCLRTVDIKRRSFVKKIFFIPSNNTLAIISKKINIFNLALNYEQEASESENTLIQTFFDSFNARFLIFRKFNYIIMCAKTGRIKKIFEYNKIPDQGFNGCGIVASEVKVVDKGYGFYLGDCDGKIRYFNVQLQEKMQLNQMPCSIKRIFHDKTHNNFITITANDILIQHPSSDGPNKEIANYRKLHSFFGHQSELEIFECKPKMNLILVSNGSNELYVIDYEFCKIHTVMYFPSDLSVIQIKCIAKLGLILVHLKPNIVYLFEFIFNPLASGLKCEFVLHDKLILPEMNVTVGTVNHETIKEGTKTTDKYQYIYGTEDGEIHVVEFSELLSKISIKESYFDKPSFNFKRNNNCAYANEIKNAKKYYIEQINKSDVKHSRGLLINGLSFRAFKEEKVKVLRVLHQSQSSILCFSESSVLKIFSLGGTTLAHFNMNHPLPIIWNFKYESPFHKRQCLKDALELIETINKRIYENKAKSITPINCNKLANEINEFFLTKNKKHADEFLSDKVLTMRSEFHIQNLMDPKMTPLIANQRDGNLTRHQTEEGPNED